MYLLFVDRTCHCPLHVSPACSALNPRWRLTKVVWKNFLPILSSVVALVNLEIRRESGREVTQREKHDGRGGHSSE